MTAKGDERELTRWIMRANRFNSAKVDVNVKALVGAHERKAKLDNSRDRNIVIQVVKHKRLLVYMFLMAFLWVSHDLGARDHTTTSRNGGAGRRNLTLRSSSFYTNGATC